MQATAFIPARFNGPPTSGNGGYSCGLLAAHIEGPARIRLHVPPPLETELRVSKAAEGGAQMYDGETLVGSGEPAALVLEVPAPPSPEAALAAMTGFPWYEGHTFPTCFVCGPERDQHDGLELFPGPVPGEGMWACLWRPAADLLDAQGNIRPEILWAALDCPGFFAALGELLRPAVLGELVGELRAEVAGLQPLVVYAWPLGSEGRKFYAGTAIATADGDIVACAKSTWIALKT
jgi:hypothetical protein